MKLLHKVTFSIGLLMLVFVFWFAIGKVTGNTVFFDGEDEYSYIILICEGADACWYHEVSCIGDELVGLEADEERVNRTGDNWIYFNDIDSLCPA
jgi:hypothetical protein